MIQARNQSGRVALIGYQHVYLPSCRWAKELILGGRIGAPRRVTIHGFWPRPSEYYARNSWAGKWRSEGGWILDSVLGNAFAHYPNLALWLTGPDLKTSNRVTAFQAELYRAYPIQTFDTCAIRASTAAGIEFLLCFTHACAEERDPVLVVEGRQGAIRFTLPDLCEFMRDGQVIERRSHGQAQQRVWMFEEWFGRMEDGRENLGCEIENALETTRLISAVSQGASIHPLPSSLIRHFVNPRGQDQWAMEGIEEVLERCVRDFKLPSELGGMAWATPPEGMGMDGFEEFAGPKDG
jgi:predicted dehydrogenase